MEGYMYGKNMWMAQDDLFDTDATLYSILPYYLTVHVFVRVTDSRQQPTSYVIVSMEAENASSVKYQYFNVWDGRCAGRSTKSHKVV